MSSNSSSDFNSTTSDSPPQSPTAVVHMPANIQEQINRPGEVSITVSILGLLLSAGIVGIYIIKWLCDGLNGWIERTSPWRRFKNSRLYQFMLRGGRNRRHLHL